MTDSEIQEALANNAEIVAEAFETAQKAVTRMAEMFSTLSSKARLKEAEGWAQPAMDAADAILTNSPERETTEAHDTERPPAPVVEDESVPVESATDGLPVVDSGPLAANIHQLLKRSGAKLTAGEVSKKLDQEDTKSVSKALVRLIDSGVVSFEGSHRAKRYFACETAQAAE